MAYRIKTVSHLTGIPKNTVLAWERRYNVVNPSREPNGYRIYSEADVAKLRALKQLVDEGHAISRAVRLVETQLQKPAGGGPPVEGDDNSYGDIVERLFDALMRFDRFAASSIVDRLLHVSFRDMLREVYYPILHRVGEQWETGEISVAQEHFASAFIRDQMTSMLLRLNCGPVGGRRVLCACFPGERHELGMFGTSIELALIGWRVTYLGADLPLEELAEVARERPPDAICVSIIHEREPDEVIPALRKLRQDVDDTVHIVVGGPGVAVLEGADLPGIRIAPGLVEPAALFEDL